MLRPAPLRLVFVLLPLLAGSTCIPPPEGAGVRGEMGRVYFNAEPDLVFETPVMVGSHFRVRVQPIDNNNDAALVTGTLRSSNPDVIFFEDPAPAASAEAFVVGPGVATIELVHDSEVKDRTSFTAARAVAVELGDGKISNAPIDPRLPDRFALVEGEGFPVFLVGLDRCGNGLLPVGNVALDVADGGVLEVEPGGPNDWTVRPRRTGPGEIAVRVDGERWSAYDVDVIDDRDIDRIEPWIAAAQYEDGLVRLWARSYTGNLEVVGVDYRWSGTDRVLVDPPIGASTVAFIDDVENVDAGPARVEAAYGDEWASLDLYLATTNDILTARVEAPAVAEPDPSAASSCEDTTCDPFAALLVGGLFSLRRLRRLRPRASRRA